jgi:hypothetical protein
MRIKKWDNFQIINESFSRSNEYSDFLSDNALSDDFFTDSLREVIDMSNCSVSVHKMISDPKGLFVKEFTDGVEYKIKYMILIVFKQKPDHTFDEFSGIVDDLSVVRMSIQEMIDRSGELELNHNKVLVEPISSKNSSGDASHTTFYIHFLGEDISDKLKDYYQRWDTSIGDEYRKMMKKLRDFYKTHDIDFDDVYDTMDDDDNINIGVFPPNEELHHVATYHKNTNKYNIYHDELKDSLKSFEG